ncbi:CHAT domain-containing protein [Tumidithrix elongata RA019]|uniref:CHAT domain-containing protein n=1 Tax=Tumidithrix elongata BACA0141 TaxID=2716417 RepID=A0AAW9Q819_9CYAN|nr:CHAT domain-containing protein [Tumidithrix elongata RA019]
MITSFFKIPTILLSVFILGLSFANPARSQNSRTPGMNYPETQPHTQPSSPRGIDPLFILNLIDGLSRSGGSETKVDLSPDLAEIRGRISRLYILLARQYLLQNQIPAACSALDKAHIAELEAYLQKRLRSRQPDSTDCYGSQLQKISQLTGSPTALIYATTSKDGLDLIFVPPSGSSAPISSSFSSYISSSMSSLQKSDEEKSDKTKQSSTQPSRQVVNRATTAEMDAVIQEFRSNLRDASSYDFLPQAQQLYDWIVRPMEPELEKAHIKTLVFVMNGNLRIIPPAALHDGKQFLIEKYAIASVPTPQLADLQRSDRSRNLQVLAMGLSESVQGWQPLPATKIEVEAIAAQVLSGSSFLNSGFTIDNLQSQVSDKKYGIVHLATHAKFVGQSPNESFVQFWNDRLTINRLASLQLSMNILTLSACETAVGENLGLAGVAVSAGAETVVASLWSVSDAGTAPLMISFYSQLRQAPSKAIALQQAQLQLLRGEIKIEKGKIIGIKGFPAIPFLDSANGVDLKHPYFWSSFTMIGNWF